MKKINISLFLIVLFTAAVFADVPRPKTPTPTPDPNQVEMFIDVTKEVTEPTIVIKKSSANQLRKILDQAEGLNNNSVAEVPETGFSNSIATVIGAMFLTLSFIFGGVWLVRSKPSKTVVGLFLIGIIAGGTVLVTANVAPPRIFGLNKNIFTTEFQGRAYAKGKIRVKIVDDSVPASPDVKLLIPISPENTSNKEE